VSLPSARGGRGARNGSHRPSPDALANERHFLRQSIEDLEEQRAAGEVDEEDFAVLDSRYGRRLAEVEAATADLAARDQAAHRQAGTADDPEVSLRRLDGVPPASRARRLRRRLGSRRARLGIGIAAAACFVAAATLLAASLAGVRLPGESATGSVTLSSAQQERETLDRAAVLGSEGQVAEAVQLYNQVLQRDPNQPDALAYGGWLVRLAGLSSKNRIVLARGDASVARAVKVAPGYPDGHALLGVILYEDFGRPGAASVQFRAALSAGASKNLLMSVAAIAAEAFAAAEEPLPPRYGAAMKSAAAQVATG
jgi:tetratricopeptide (TPR) repeat protein